VLLSHATPAPIVYSHGLAASGPVAGVGGVTGSCVGVLGVGAG
jgi:hypothetical protein